MSPEGGPGAESGGGRRLVGLVRVVGDDASIAYVQDLLVHPHWQRRGIGARLLRDAMERFARVRQLLLLTDDAPAVRAFYEAMGLGPVGEGHCVAYMRRGGRLTGAPTGDGALHRRPRAAGSERESGPRRLACGTAAARALRCAAPDSGAPHRGVDLAGQTSGSSTDRYRAVYSSSSRVMPRTDSKSETFQNDRSRTCADRRRRRSPQRAAVRSRRSGAARAAACRCAARRPSSRPARRRPPWERS